MCDYSLHHVQSRPAQVDDKLVVTTFPGTITRGFMAEGAPGCAICLKPGTEIAFVGDGVLYADVTHFTVKHPDNVARFRQIDLDNRYAHHDALEFPGGRIIRVTHLALGQHATVLQLPAEPAPKGERAETARSVETLETA